MPPRSNLMGESHTRLPQVMTTHSDNRKTTDFFKRSYEMSKYIVDKRLGKNQKWNRVAEKLYESCKEMNLKYEPFFNGIPTKLCLTKDNLYDSCIEVMKEVLCDNECNFGRIVSIYTFTLVLAEYCSKTEGLKDNDSIEQLLQATSEVMYQNKEWFQKNNGWDGLVEFLTHPSESFWKGVVITTVGLSALAGLIYAKS